MLSVIICTYNPAESIFTKCLAAISAAADRFAPLEIIIIDNNSSIQLEESEYIGVFLEKHINARMLRETSPGLTKARLRGIQEARGDLFIFIDDDNLIDPDYFVEAQRIKIDYEFIGAYSGKIVLSYDTPPPVWTKKFWGLLVHRDFKGSFWSNIYFEQNSMPCGAGLCIRKEVAQYYLSLHNNGKREFILDRAKQGFLSGGDNDIAMCAIDVGLGMGIFDSLKMQHFTPSNRFSLQYLEKLAYGIYYSEVILRCMRAQTMVSKSAIRSIAAYLRTFLMKPKDGIINRACLRGAADAYSFIKKRK